MPPMQTPTYAVLVGVLVWIMHRWERALRIPGYGR